MNTFDLQWKKSIKMSVQMFTKHRLLKCLNVENVRKTLVEMYQMENLLKSTISTKINIPTANAKKKRELNKRVECNSRKMQLKRSLLIGHFELNQTVYKTEFEWCVCSITYCSMNEKRSLNALRSPLTAIQAVYLLSHLSGFQFENFVQNNCGISTATWHYGLITDAQINHFTFA